MSARRRRAAALGLLLAVVTATTGCGSACTSSAAHVQALLLDRSPSDAANMPTYQTLAHTVIRHAVVRHAHVLVGTVGTLGDARWEIDRRLEVTARNAFGCQRKRRQAASQVNRRIDALFAAPTPEGSSDLIATLIATGRTLANEPQPADVWVDSDTHQVGSGVDLYHDDLDPTSVGETLERLRAEGLLADLHGARVHFVGVGLAKHPLPNARERLIEAFWRRWVSASRGTVVSYDTRIGTLDRAT